MMDDTLYRAYLSGDQSAGDQLMLRNGDVVTAYLTAFLRNDHDAEDLMLDCFAELLIKKPKIQDGKFKAYLFRMARFKANRLWRIRLRRNEFSLDESLIADNESLEDAAIHTQRDAALQKCLNRIAPKYREALWLVYGQGMSYAQVAEIKGCSVGSIHSQLDVGKKKLREELEKEGITHADI